MAKKYNYFHFLVRIDNNIKIEPNIIEGIKRAIWRYVKDIPITDVRGAKSLNMTHLRFESVKD